MSQADVCIFGEDSDTILIKTTLISAMSDLRKRYLRRVVLLSLASMSYAAISNANLGIISQFASQNGNEWIGPLSIALVFLGSGTGALYNQYIDRWQYKYIIFCGAMGWNIFISFSVMFLFIGFSDWVIAIIIIGSVACGLLMSAYYNGLNNFVNECGKRDNRTNSYFGINICINQCSNILGNALSALLIKPLGQKTYSFVMLGLSIAISLLFLLAKDFPKESQDLQQSIIEQEDKGQVSSLVESPSQPVKAPLLLFFVFAFSGVMISFVYSELSVTFYKYYPQIEEQEELNRLTFITLMVQGCGEFLGGLVLGVFATKMRKIVLFNSLNSVLFMVCCVIMWQGFEDKQEWMVQVTAFFIGFADCFGFALALSISGKWDQSGISLFNFGQSFTVALLSTVYIFLGVPYVIIIYGGYLLLASFASVKYQSSIQEGGK